ncbi:hypothetical protein ACFQ6N_33240 [Kitasatospora sp. NPDC056446]|uniref:hypothetical protein n=1 Tax=Kitasatospora sp. NPDC056446 TaxID=3345819 RepID=UPI003674E39C
MRPSYDAEHPHSATPIYDELYSEYRRLFRALPGDRSGEEDLVFTGFAVRDGYPVLGEQRPYPPQHQAFHTLAGQAPGLPQFMSSQPHGAGAASGHHAGQAHDHHGHHHSHTGHHGHPGVHHTGAHHTGAHHAAAHPEPAAPTDVGLIHAPPAPTPAPGTGTVGGHSQPASGAAQFTNGQGWVAAGYLGSGPYPTPAPAAVPVPMPMPMPAPPAPPAPSPVMGTATGLATPRPTGGRHRQMLSLPPGRNGDHH